MSATFRWLADSTVSGCTSAGVVSTASVGGETGKVSSTALSLYVSGSSSAAFGSQKGSLTPLALACSGPRAA
eukprot:7437615-Ditylum_brightwellii.AAC.1